MSYHSSEEQKAHYTTGHFPLPSEVGGVKYFFKTMTLYSNTHKKLFAVLYISKCLAVDFEMKLCCCPVHTLYC